MKFLLVVLFVAISTTSAFPRKPFYRAQSDKRIPGRYIVGINGDDLMKNRDLVVKAIMTLQKGGSIGIRLNKILTNVISVEMTDEALLMVLAHEGVSYVEEDSIFSVAAVSSWGLDRIDQRDLPLDDTFAPSGDGSGVNIYIVDTGVKYSHSDFGGRALYFHDSLNGNGVDCNGHGSHCAGIAASATYGVANNAYIWGLRALSCIGLGTNIDIIEGLEIIRYQGFLPGVVLVAMSGPASYSLDNEIRLLKVAGYTMVVPAGNNGEDACYYSPARSANAITVGASDSNDVMSTFSNYGACVGMLAPGEDIRSTWHDSDTAINVVSGTSMAAAHVAGAAALLLDLDPGLTPDEVETQLLFDASVDKLTSVNTSPNLLLYVY